jgi:hypothetical protein
MRGVQPRSLLLGALLHATQAQQQRESASTNVFNQAELFAHWTSEKINSAIPLDLKIDPLSGEGFVIRRDELVSYADMFASKEQRVVTPDATLIRLNKMLDEDVLTQELETTHVRKNRLGGRHRQNQRSLSSTIDLSSISFTRRLQESDADSFALNSKPSKRSKKQQIKQEKGMKDKHPKNEGGRRKKKLLPKIDDMNPSRGDKIASTQTFSAKVSRSASTLAQIRDVTFRIVDPTGESSDWLPVPKGNEEDVYEITIEGFDAYPGSKWKYQMSVKDDEGRSVESPNVMFKVGGEASLGVETMYDDNTYYEEEPNAFDRNDQVDLMDFDVVGDSNWPYGGGIQSATGRILFEFHGSETYVCSGTVVKDGDLEGRSIILVSTK